MVYKVQVMTEEEVKRYEKQRADEDECCRKIYLFCCTILCILVSVYAIVMSILIIIHIIHMNENKEINEINDFQLCNGSQNR